MTQRHGLSVPAAELLDEFEQQSLAPPGTVVLTARLRLIAPALFGGFDPRGWSRRASGGCS